MIKENSRLNIHSIPELFLVPIVLDIIPCKYFTSWIERIFTYNLANIIPIGVALWAFVTGMIIFWFGKSSEYYMGITYREIYNAIIKKKKFMIEVEEASISSIAVMLLASFYEWKITFLICILIQFLTMSIMYYAIKSSVSKEGIEKAVCDNINDIVKVFESMEEKGIVGRQSEICIEEAIFVKAIRGIDKGDIKGIRNLVRILRATGLYQIEGGQAIAMGRFLTDEILTTTLPREVKLEIIQDLFLGNEACAVDLQKGIIFALVENFDYSMFDQIKSLIACVEKKRRKKGNDGDREEYVTWYIAAFIFLTRFMQYEKNHIFIHDIVNYLETEEKYFPEKMWEKDILTNWYRLCELQGCDPMENIDMIMKITEGY